MFYFVLGYSQLTMLWFQVNREGAFLLPHILRLWSIKETGIQIQWDGYFETLVCHSLGQLALRIKSYSMPQHLSSHSLVWWVASRASLNLVTASQSVSSVAQSCLTLCDPMDCSTPGLPVHHELPEFTQTHVHQVSEAIQPAHPLSSPSPPPSIFPSIRVFSNESLLHIRWPKYWSFNFSISLSKEHPGLISFRMDWLDLLAVQGTLKSLFQNHSSKASIFGTQLSLKRIFLFFEKDISLRKANSRQAHEKMLRITNY